MKKIYALKLQQSTWCQCPDCTRFCKVCGVDIDISSGKYLYIPFKGLKLVWRRMIVGEYGEFFCINCQRDEKIKKILK